jgi:hypothetical protein
VADVDADRLPHHTRPIRHTGTRVRESGGGRAGGRAIHSRRTSSNRPGGNSLNMAFTGCVYCVNRYYSHMSGVVAIAERVVERAPGLIAAPTAPTAAVIGIILLLDQVFDVFLSASAPAEAAVQRLGGVPAGRSHSLESDTVGARRVAPAMPDPEPVLVNTELVEGEGNRAMCPAGCQPRELVHDTVQRRDGVYADRNEAREQGRRLGPSDGEGPRYESDYRLCECGPAPCE